MVPQLKMHVDLERLLDLAQELESIQQNIESISSTYKGCRQQLDKSIATMPDVQHMMLDITHELEEIILSTEQYGQGLYMANREYRIADNKVMEMYMNLQDVHIDNRPNTIHETVVRQIETSSLIQIKERSIICPLPNKEDFSQEHMIAGNIQDGKNILIRTWTQYL